MIIVVHDWHADVGQPQVLKDVHRDASTESGRQHCRSAGSLLHYVNHSSRRWQIHRSPGSAVTALVQNLCNLRVRAPLFNGRVMVDHIKALLLDESADLPELLLRNLA